MDGIILNAEKKNHYIKLFRDKGFNCFPIPRYQDIETGQKKADSRYKASETIQNQEIKDDENYGIIPIKGKKNCILDLDKKEVYRKFANEVISQGYMIIETGMGWHIPVQNLSGNISKTELFNYNIQDKKIIEIQGPDHYVIGAESIIFHPELKKKTKYTNVGSEKIFDGKGKDFHDFVDFICKALNVTSKRKSSRSSYMYLRERFENRKIPQKGQSNDYFRMAALDCNTKNLSREQAIEEIQIIYDLWKNSDCYSGRPWSNILAKIDEVYDKNQTIKQGHPLKKEKRTLTDEVLAYVKETKTLYSNVYTKKIYELRNGFLQSIEKSLQKELQPLYEKMKKGEYEDIVFKLIGLNDDLPKTNNDLYAFKNGIIDANTKEFVDTAEIAGMGWEDYNYLPKTKENEPAEFLKIMFDNIPQSEHPRVKAGLKGILEGRLDPKISIILGKSGVGKSTALVILVMVLGDEYALTVELNQFFDDKFIRAKISGKRLLVFQDVPNKWKHFDILKTITGEVKKTERGFYSDSETFDNKLKVWASGNYLPIIPNDEKDPMHTRRLSLVHNTRKEAYEEDTSFAEKISKDEGEKIISWILNLTDEECQYEDKATNQKEWEEIAEAERIWIQQKYEPSLDNETEHSVISLVELFRENTKRDTTLDQMSEVLKSVGFAIRRNVITNLKDRSHQNQTQKMSNVDA